MDDSWFRDPAAPAFAAHLVAWFGFWSVFVMMAADGLRARFELASLGPLETVSATVFGLVFALPVMVAATARDVVRADRSFASPAATWFAVLTPPLWVAARAIAWRSYMHLLGFAASALMLFTWFAPTDLVESTTGRALRPLLELLGVSL